jgi:hypothetical protein
MKCRIIAVCAILFLSSFCLLRAGEIMMIGNSATEDGKVTFSDPNTLSIDSGGSSPDKINLSDVLEADFSNTEFHLDYFCSIGSQSTALPSNWQMKDIAPVDIPGSFTYANGELTLKGLGCDLAGEDDLFFFTGQQWHGNGQWTLHMKEFDPVATASEIGLMLRDSLKVGSIMTSFGEMASGTGWKVGRGQVGVHSGWEDFSDNNPGWLRMTRINQSLDMEVSPDGQTWESIGEQDINLSRDAWIGIFFNSRQDKVIGKATVDQITFQPVSPLPENFPPGALLKDGSFLAGYFNWLNPKQGSFNRGGQEVFIAPDKIAVVVFHPMTLQQLSSVGDQAGLLMKNGDFLDATLTSLQGTYVQMDSIALGPVDYFSDSIRACIFQKDNSEPFAYEVRLTDGSILRAKSFETNSAKITIHTTAGIDVPIAESEIAQIRAGLSRAQPLITLAWKAASLASTAPAPQSKDQNTPATASTNAAPARGAVAASTPPSKATPNGSAHVLTWAGSDQEQIMAAPVGTTVSFPMSGKFGAAAMRVVVGPGTAPGTKVSVQLTADGQKIPGDLVFTAGDKPRFMKISLGKSQVFSLTADSSDANAKILLIDPVALK